MAATLTHFTEEIQLSATESTLISAGATEKKFIGSIALTNTSTSAVEFTLWLIGDTTTGTTGSGGNWSVKRTIAANSVIRVPELVGQVLDNSMKLSGLAGTASVVNVRISGTTET
jgi:hypothetical protein